MRLVAGTIALAALLLTVACHGPSIGREGAVAYFVEHRGSLQQVVDEAVLCQPETGRIDPTDTFRCASSRDPEGLKGAMERASAQWISVRYDMEGEERTLRAVHIAIRSQGMAFAGVIEEFIFESAPALSAEYQRRDDGIAVIERQPVTEAPHNWYWRKIDR